jgi:hypothetical protein
MIATRELTFEFVHSIPVDLEAGRLYISTEFATAMHQCCCGCGNIVVTPLSPAFWTLIFDGSTVSLNPSIGNWNFPCRSHYFIDRNRVAWVPRWSEKQIALSRASATARRDALFGHTNATASPSDRTSAWRRMKSWFWRE